ncbi:MAG: LarC family nickel insertion protein, partial [Chloroflexi bacterium]|nr:LarC family nickel insertion protein [Chloroflexota bacterium]
GAIDTVVDVVGSLIGLAMLGIERVSCSPLNLGKGFVECAHGKLPVPAPVTAELLKGIPVYVAGMESELTTPTGAAIVSGVASCFGDMPSMLVHSVGYGAGARDPGGVPNLLRLFVGEVLQPSDDYLAETIVVLESNIDDMNPQFYDHIMESLLSAGALDVFLTPVQMKKNRPGTMVSVVASADTVRHMLDILLGESTTLGVRVSETRRFSLSRSSHCVETKFGPIRVKVAYKGGAVAKVMPEYEDCKKAAQDNHVPISLVYSEAAGYRQKAEPSQGHIGQ